VTTGRPASLLSQGSLLLAAMYPVAVYLLLDQGAVRLAGLLLIAALLLRFAVPGARRGETLALIALGVAFAAAILLTGSEQLARLYPVGVSLVLLVVFGLTLLNPPSMIERFARATGATLDAAGERYTRTLTVTWCGFFFCNGAIALYTAVAASREWWALWNGLLSYLLAGSLLIGERLVRPLLRRRLAGASGS
jgi:uncharacterized membrane protein